MLPVAVTGADPLTFDHERARARDTARPHPIGHTLARQRRRIERQGMTLDAHEVHADPVTAAQDHQIAGTSALHIDDRTLTVTDNRTTSLGSRSSEPSAAFSARYSSGESGNKPLSTITTKIRNTQLWKACDEQRGPRPPTT